MLRFDLSAVKQIRDGEIISPMIVEIAEKCHLQALGLLLVEIHLLFKDYLTAYYYKCIRELLDIKKISVNTVVAKIDIKFSQNKTQSALSL